VSSSVFPSFAGIKANREARAEYRTTVFDSLSGREQRTVEWSYPRHRWKLVLEFARARSVDVAAEIEQLWSFFQAHAGSGDSFLFRDPDDDVATDCGFGVGDGTTAAFQLQRSLAGAVPSTYEAVQASTKRRRNYATNLGAFSGAGNTGTGIAAVLTQNAGIAPDGTATAMRAFISIGAGTTLGDRSTFSSGVGLPSSSDGQTYTGSIWLRTLTGTANVRIRLGSATQNITVTTTWQRFSITRPWASSADSDTTGLSVLVRGTWGTDQSADLLVWGPVVERGSTVTPTMPADGTGTATSTPSYWPAMGSFEPATEPAPGWYPTLSDDGLGQRMLVPWSRTNLLTYSEQLDNAAWSKGFVTVTANAVAAPDGTTTADKLAETAATNQHFVSQAVSVAQGRTYTLSVYAKAVERTKVELQIYAAADSSIARFDLATGTVSYTSIGGTAANATASIYPCGNGWFRVSLSHRVGTAGTPACSLALLDAAGAQSYLGVAGSGAYFWGAQLVAEDSAGDYIPTTSATASRTDYSVSNGLVTCAVAPRSGAQLAWSGPFYLRVRFEQDSLGLDRIVAGLWGGRGLHLISVK